MAKGQTHSGNKKSSHYEFKRRCEKCGIHRAKYLIGRLYLCKECVR